MDSEDSGGIIKRSETMSNRNKRVKLSNPEYCPVCNHPTVTHLGITQSCITKVVHIRSPKIRKVLKGVK